MDIFTTQLTRVVPVPIKPASLKVKALLKEAANSKLSQDPDHLENHEYYFTSEEDQYHGSQKDKSQQEQGEQKQDVQSDTEINSKKDDRDSEAEKNQGKTKHLDLYA